MTSGRLPSSARPGSRLFPKTRSWFALDAPLELLSPLSVFRVLLVLALVTWPVIGLTAPRSEFEPLGLGAVAAVTAVTAAIWLASLRVKKLDVRGCRALTAYLTGAVAVLVWSSNGGGPAVAFVLFLVPLSVCSALFLGRRTVVVQLVGTGVLLSVALGPGLGVVRAGSTAVAGVLALSLAPVAVIFLARSARRHDTVDPDTGVPNGFGLAQRLAAGEHTVYLVAAVVLDGIGNAREALGYQVGTELLRRAVEDLGQVLPADAVIGRVTGDELVVTLGLDAEALDLGRSVPPGSSVTPPGSVSDAHLGGRRRHLAGRHPGPGHRHRAVPGGRHRSVARRPRGPDRGPLGRRQRGRAGPPGVAERPSRRRFGPVGWRCGTGTTTP